MKACPAGCDGGYFGNGTCVADICDRCEGEGRVESWYDRLPGARRAHRRWQITKYVYDQRMMRVRHWRALVRQYRRDPHCSTVAAYQAVHRNMLDDAPMLRSVIENQLRRQVVDFTPLRWRVDVAKRAMRGDLVDPYEYVTSVSVNTQTPAFFERNQAVVLYEVHRRLRTPLESRTDVIVADRPASWPNPPWPAR